MGRLDSPSETRIPSRATGSAAEPKTSVPPPPPPLVSDGAVPPVDSLSPPPHPAAMRARNATSGRANLSSFPLTLFSFRYDRPQGGRHVSIREVGRHGNPGVSPEVQTGVRIDCAVWTTPLYYERLSWPEVRRAAAEERVCLIPVATLEDHGPHMPIDTDLRITAEICRRAAEAAPDEIVLLPAIP